MITGSIGLALVAAILLVLGVLHGPEFYYYASIGASLLAAFALIAGLRQHALAQRAGWGSAVYASTGTRSSGPGRADVARPAEVPAPRAGQRSPLTVEAGPRASRDEVSDEASDEGHGPDLAGTGLPDEPPEQPLTAAAAARLSRSGTEVVVVDGRPRFHLAGCLHLLGRATQRLPVLEAMDGGFTPCALCQPAGAGDVSERSS